MDSEPQPATKTEWALLLLGFLFPILLLVACGDDRGSNQPPGTGGGEKGIPGGPAGALSGLAVWATWACGVGLLLCGAAAFWLPNKLTIAKLALCCLAGIAVSFLLHWIADHTALVVGGCAVVLLLGAIAVAWVHRVDVKKRTGLDLNWLCRVKKS